MKFKEYNLTNKEGKSNCVIRSFAKMYNKEYDYIFSELVKLSKSLKCESFNEQKVFETYMKKNNTESISYGKNIKIKDLELDKDSYIVFCWDKNEVYHMIPIINNTIYDKDNRCLELFTLVIYKKIDK